MASRGFKRVTVSIHREFEAAARAVLARHSVVPPNTIDYSGQHLSFSIDLARIPDGHGGLVEAVITREVEGARP